MNFRLQYFQDELKSGGGGRRELPDEKEIPRTGKSVTVSTGVRGAEDRSHYTCWLIKKGDPGD